MSIPDPDLPTGGTITRIAAQQRTAGRVSVYLDGEFAFGIDENVLVRHGLHVGSTLAPDDVRTILSTESEVRARQVALEYLAARQRTVQEVRQKLQKKEFDPRAIDGAIARMIELGYLDDEAYARDYVRVRIGSRGYGPRRIAGELARRGVAAETVEAALLDADQETLVELAVAQGRKKWDHLARETDPRKRKKKLTDFLLRRGFGYDIVRRVVQACSQGRA